MTASYFAPKFRWVLSIIFQSRITSQRRHNSVIRAIFVVDENLRGVQKKICAVAAWQVVSNFWKVSYLIGLPLSSTHNMYCKWKPREVKVSNGYQNFGEAQWKPRVSCYSSIQEKNCLKTFKGSVPESFINNIKKVANGYLKRKFYSTTNL